MLQLSGGATVTAGSASPVVVAARGAPTGAKLYPPVVTDTAPDTVNVLNKVKEESAVKTTSPNPTQLPVGVI